MIENAEKVISKPRGTTVASAVSKSQRPVSSTTCKLSSRRVYVDDGETAKPDPGRKVISRQSSVQVTISSKNGKRREPSRSETHYRDEKDSYESRQRSRVVIKRDRDVRQDDYSSGFSSDEEPQQNVRLRRPPVKKESERVAYRDESTVVTGGRSKSNTPDPSKDRPRRDVKVRHSREKDEPPAKSRLHPEDRDKGRMVKSRDHHRESHSSHTSDSKYVQKAVSSRDRERSKSYEDSKDMGEREDRGDRRRMKIQRSGSRDVVEPKERSSRDENRPRDHNENRSEGKPVKRTVSLSSEQKEKDSKMDRPVETKKLDRKVSTFEEEKFEPDYDEPDSDDEATGGDKHQDDSDSDDGSEQSFGSGSRSPSPSSRKRKASSGDSLSPEPEKKKHKHKKKEKKAKKHKKHKKHKHKHKSKKSKSKEEKE